MNSRQKQVQMSLLKNEKAVIKQIEKTYQEAIAEIDKFILQLLARKDTENLQSIIYQVKYQQAIKKELESYLKVLHSKNFKTVDEYLKECYEQAHIGTLFDLQGQGIPLILPLDQEQIIKAITLNSKLSAPLYNSLGYNVDVLKINVMMEISRGIAQSLSYQEIARNLKNVTNVDYNKELLKLRDTEYSRKQLTMYSREQLKKVQMLLSNGTAHLTEEQDLHIRHLMV